jgi:3-hydroxyacyl-CoA dehydrogenase
VIGTALLQPANVMKLLEIVRGAKTGKDVLATALALSKKSRRPAWSRACATASSATA